MTFRYLKLELKKFLLTLARSAMFLLTLSAFIAAVVFVLLSFGSEIRRLDPVRVSVYIPGDEPVTRLGIRLLSGMDSFERVCVFEYAKSAEEVKGSVEAGKAGAGIVFPEDFAREVYLGERAEALLYLPGDDQVSRLFGEVIRSGVDMLATGRAGVAAMWRAKDLAVSESVEAGSESIEAGSESIEAVSESVEAGSESIEAVSESIEAESEPESNGSPKTSISEGKLIFSDADNIGDYTANAYLSDVFDRERFYDVIKVSRFSLPFMPGGLKEGEYYIAFGLFSVLLLCGVNFSGFYGNYSQCLADKLKIAGIGGLKAGAIRVLSIWSALIILLAVYYAGLTTLAYYFSFFRYTVSPGLFVPLVPITGLIALYDHLVLSACGGEREGVVVLWVLDLIILAAIALL